MTRRRVPLGVIAAIFESRPNVTIDIASLCLKSGNACVLRGGSEAIQSNTALARIAAEAETAAGVPEGALQFVESTDRARVADMLALREHIDLVVPRGGAELIRFVADNATMPVLTGGIGVCHTYVDRAADLKKAADIAVNAKTRNYSICNALDTLLVHRDVAGAFLPALAPRWAEKGVEMRCDPEAMAALPPGPGVERGARGRRRLRARVPGPRRVREGRRVAGRSARPHRALRHRTFGRHRHRGLRGRRGGS